MHRHRVIKTPFFLELLVRDDGVHIGFELFNPALLFQTADSIRECFLLPPQDFVWEEARVGLVDGLPKMPLLLVVSWALNVGGQVEVVLHERLVKERFSDFQAVRSSGSVDSEHVELIQLLNQPF